MTSPAQLLSDLNRLGVSVSLDGDELLVKAPKDALTAALHEELRERKPDVVALLRAAAWLTTSASQASNGRVSLSHAQKRIWFLDQLEPGNAVWNVASIFSIEGHLDTRALEHALSEIVSRHAVLRSTFDATDGIPYACIAPASEWSMAKRSAGEGNLLAEAQIDAARPIELKTGPVFRAVLLEAGPGRYCLSLSVHHIVCDGWSLGLLSKELSALYNAFAVGRASPLPALPSSYADYVAWEHATGAQVSEADMVWWRTRLAGPLPTLELGDQRRQSSAAAPQGRRLSMAIPEAETARLHLLARTCGVTPFMLLLAAFKALLYRYTGVEDIAVGTVSSYRKRREFEPLIGMFANPVVLRTSLSGSPSFQETLDRVRETVVTAFSHDTMPFDRLIEELHPDRHASRPPLFQVSFAYQNLPRAELELKGARLSQERVEIPHARYDLSVEIWVTGFGMTCDFEFRTALFKVAAIERMQEHYLRILQSVIVDAEIRISDLTLLSDLERTALIARGMGAADGYPEDPVHLLFEAQCRRNPAAAALVDGERVVSYCELSAMANALCAELKKHGVGAGMTVAILIERSVESIVAMLAILKCGGIYLVLDTEHPEERLRFLAQDAEARIVLVNSGDEHTRKWPAEFEYLDIASATSPANLSASVPVGSEAAAETTLHSPMCLLYTSGSTGIPKGVEICHRGLVRLLFSRECGAFGSGEAVLHMAPESFDASLLEIWGPLVHGGCTVICRERHPDLASLKTLIEKNKVRAAWLTSSLLNWIVDEAPDTLSSLERIYTGGEALSVAHIRRAYEALPDVAIFNGYGPTESTIFTCLYAIPRELAADVASIPIGRPISNTSVYVLDGNRHLVPAGVPGELYIGGDALALGYRNRPELNAERFISNPFATQGQLYASGDRCVHRPDGTLEFIGRLDSQLKVRGHRVEPGEIEAAMAWHPDVSACAVVLRTRPDLDTQRGDIVVAWFAASPGLQPDSLRAMLKDTLPSYMMPNLFLRLDALPLLANGKVDRAALAARPLPEAPSYDLQSKPDNGFERDRVQLIAQSMAELLGLPHVRHDDDFFALGGHSLLAMQLIARIESLLGRKVSAAMLFRSATPETIAQFLHDESDCRPRRLLPLRSSGDQPPLFCLHLLDGSIHDYLVLVRQLDHALPVYGLCPGELDLNRKSVWTLPEIAAEYIDEIKRVRPLGPYRLCGYSSAGTLAFEMARQLTGQGHEVSLFLLDSFAPLNLRSLSTVQLFKLAGAFARSGGRRENAIRLLSRASRHFRKKMTSSLQKIRTEHELKTAEKDEALAAMLRRAMKTYRSRTFSGKALLFKAQHEGRYQKYDFDGCNNWSRLLRGGVELQPIPGNHRQIMQQPSVELLARQLQQSLLKG